jgi:acyl-CoA synthetase (NDP forming)
LREGKRRPQREKDQRMSAKSNDVLLRLIAPRSVAIIGASDDPSRIGGRPLSYILAGGFRGDIFPVNPNRATVQGIAAYPSIGAVGRPIDVAIVALPAAQVAAALRECAAAGVGGCIIFSAGFAEVDAEGAARQGEIADIARAMGMRIVGPNCLGLFNVEAGFYPTFTASLDRGLPAPGRLSIVSQSGAFGSHLYFDARRRGVGMRYWLTSGNESDVHVAEWLRLVAEDPGTDVVLAYAEAIKDGPLLIEALEVARSNRKPVIFMKVGRSTVGAEAIASHTAALAGSDAVFDAVLRQYGAHRAATADEMVYLAEACCHGRYPAGRRLGIVSISGGVGALMADAAEDFDLAVAPMPEEAQKELKVALPFAAVRNPVDMTAQAFNNLSLVGTNFETILRDGGYDVLIAFLTSIPGSPAMAEPLLELLGSVRKRYPETLMILSMLVSDELRTRYQDAGFLLVDDPTRAVEVAATLADFGEWFARREALLGGGHATPSRLKVGEILSEHAAKQILAAAGIAVAEERLARDGDEAAAAFAAFNRQVAMKITSPDIVHKTEIGGVLLGVSDATAARAGFETLIPRAREKRPDARIEGVLVAPMVTGGVEMILGVKRDPTFGPIVMLGLGGIFVEVFKDFTLRRAPFDEDTGAAMVGELKGGALLHGVRGQPRADKAALVSALVRLSEFAAAEGERLESIDINPFLVLPEGQGGLALDALIATRVIS